MSEKMLNLIEAANRLNVPEATLRYWVHRGIAPPSARIGRRRFFRESDVEAFITEQFAKAGRDLA